MIAIDTLSDEQQRALDLALAFVDGKSVSTITPKELRIGGLAGCGKTTLLAALVRRRPGLVVAAPTGRAAARLREKGVPRADTLHKLLMRPVIEKVYDSRLGHLERLVGFVGDGAAFDGELHEVVAIDEGSMISGKMYDRLRKRFARIVTFGDFGQLEPVIPKNDDDYDPQLLIDGKRDVTLSRVFRQGANSPILDFAYEIRTGKSVSAGKSPALHVAFVKKKINVGKVVDVGADVILVAYNETRHAINAEVRRRLGYTEPLMVGDRVVCLANDYTHEVFNGELYDVARLESRRGSHVWATLSDSLGRTREAPVWVDALGRDVDPRDRPEGGKLRPVRFDYGYALTAHKAQGSEWDHVLVIDELGLLPDHRRMPPDPAGNRRWRYTAATRAAKRLTYLRGSPW